MFRLTIASQALLLVILGSVPLIVPAGDILPTITENRTEVAHKVARLRELGALYVTFSANSAKVITAGMQDTLGVWTWQHGDPTNHALSMPAVSGISRANIAIAVSPDGHYIAATHAMDRPDKTKPIGQTNSSCRTIQIWDANTERPLIDLDGLPAWCDSGGILFSHNSDLLFVIEGGQELCPNRADHVAVFSTKDWKRLWSICLKESEPGQLAVSPDDKLIAIGGYHQVKVDQSARPDAPMFESHEVVAIVDIEAHQTTRVIDGALPDQFDIEALAWSPDGRRLAVGGGNRRGDSRTDALKIYDPNSGTLVFTENSEYSDVKGIAYTNDGKYFIEATINKQVRIWDGSHAHLLQSFPVGWGSVFDNLFNALAVSPNNRYFAVTQQQGTTIYELK
jgi:WD40 repeat protein